MPCTALSVPSWSRSMPEVAANSSSPGSADSSSWTAAPPARTSARARSTQSSSSSEGCAGAQAISSIASSAATRLDAADSTAGRCWSLVTVAFRLDPRGSVPPSSQDGTGPTGLDPGKCGEVARDDRSRPVASDGRRRPRRDRRGRCCARCRTFSDRPGRRPPPVRRVRPAGARRCSPASPHLGGAGAATRRRSGQRPPVRSTTDRPATGAAGGRGRSAARPKRRSRGRRASRREAPSPRSRPSRRSGGRSRWCCRRTCWRRSRR